MPIPNLRRKNIFGGGGRVPGPDFGNLFRDPNITVTRPQTQQYYSGPGSGAWPGDQPSRRFQRSYGGGGGGSNIGGGGDLQYSYDPSLELAQQELGLQESAQDLEREKVTGELELGGRAADVDQQRANISKYLAEHPDMQIVSPKGGNYIAFNPKTGETVDLEIPTGSLSDEDLASFRSGKNIEEIEARGKESRKTEEVRQAGAKRLTTSRALAAGQTRTEQHVNKMELEAIKHGYTVDAKNNILPSQIKNKILNQAQEFIAKNPALADHVTIASDGTITVDDPAGGILGIGDYSQEDYDKIIAGIWGDDTGTDTGGSVGVVSPDGKTGTIPSSQLEAALKEGYTRSQ